ncbi:GNAT family N-acetyltransferase [Streptomyces albidoflavus]
MATAPWPDESTSGAPADTRSQRESNTRETFPPPSGPPGGVGGVCGARLICGDGRASGRRGAAGGARGTGYGRWRDRPRPDSRALLRPAARADVAPRDPGRTTCGARPVGRGGRGGKGGAERALIEAVRVRVDRRGGGRGRAPMERAVERARDRGCALVQLTSDKRRADAHRFYTGLGFTPSHEGVKLALPRTTPADNWLLVN